MGGDYTRTPILFSWSSGKDSALALQRIVSEDRYDVTLITTITEEYGRVSMHGVRERLLDMQTAAIGFPVEKIRIPAQCSDQKYGEIMTQVLGRHREIGVESVVFGDIHLEDIRHYREKNLAKAGMKGIYPIWGENPLELSRSFLRLGFGAVITCVDATLLDGGFSGRPYDAAFLASLPPGVDPCGELGEFHTFVHSGPLFSNPVPFVTGETVVRDGRFYFTDILSSQPPLSAL